MAQELLINVNVSGEEELPKIDKNIEKIGKTTNKTKNALTEMRKEIKNAKADMLTFAEGSAEYNAAMQKAAAGADKMRDINDKVKASQRDIGVVAKNVAGSVSGLAGAFATAQGVIALFGVENDAVAKTLLKVQASLSVASGIAQFADSLDSMKDLYNALKLNVLASAAAKQVETVASVENTVANTAEAAAITATGTASKVTGKAMMAALGPYALIAAAIAAVVTGVILLIKKMNEVPEDIKINVEMDEKVSEKLVTNIQKAHQFAIDYNAAVKSGNKERISDLEELNKKEFGLNKDRLKAIGNNVDAWKTAFSDYIEIAKRAYKEEMLIKASAESESSYSVYLDRFNKAKEKRLKLIKELRAEGKTPETNIQAAASGSIFYSLSIKSDKIKELYDISKEFNESAKLAAESFFKVKEDQARLDKFEKENPRIVSTISTEPTKTTGGGGGGKTEKTGTYIKTDKELLAELASEGVNETNELRKQELADEMKAKLVASRQGPKGTNEPLVSGEIPLLDVTSGIDNANIKGELLLKTINGIQPAIDNINVGDKMTQIFGSEDMQKGLDTANSILNSMQYINNSILDMYYYKQEASDNYYDSEEDRINNLVISDEEKNKKLAENDKKRYEEQKKLFEAQKKYQIASAWINFASGSVAALAGGIRDLGPIAGPIVAGVEIAALLASTIAQTNAISKQKMDSPSNGSSGSSGSASANVPTYLALSPNKTSLTSSEENLNMMNNGNKTNNVSVVKVSDINNVQNKVKVRDNNTNY